MKKYIFIFILATLAFSCNKPVVQESVAEFMVVHASPNTPDFEVYIDNKPVIVYPLEFTNNTYYRKILSGMRKVTIVISGNPYFDTTLNFVRDRTYSLMVYDEPLHIKMKMIVDDLAPTGGGNFKYRFFQFIPDVDSLDLVDALTNEVFCNNYDFGESEDWKSHQGGVFRWELRKQPGGQVIYSSWKNDTLEAGNVYTMFCSGFTLTQTADTIGIWKISHGEF